ncbi:MAG: hypothetical protein LBB04_03210 [Oscillospiraceae bacterium]|nr:hypothetical protein [Oscillospiraceae bacterium]
MYPEKELHSELAFISYYFHWSLREVMELDHVSRRRWCKEISKINDLVSNKPKNIFDVK